MCVYVCSEVTCGKNIVKKDDGHKNKSMHAEMSTMDDQDQDNACRLRWRDRLRGEHGRGQPSHCGTPCTYNTSREERRKKKHIQVNTEWS